MWNILIDELTAQNGAGLEFRFVVIAWCILVVGMVMHTVIQHKRKQTQYKTIRQYKKVS